MSVDHPALVVIGIFLAYTVVVAALWKVNRVDYRTIADDRTAIVKGIVVPIGVGAVFLAIAVSVLGAWHDSMVETSDLAPAWVIVVPIVFGLVALLNISTIDFRFAGNALPLLLLGTLLVGFAEEMVTRGVMIVGLREQGWSELRVYLVCTALFALLHGINAFFGQSTKDTVQQIVMAFIAGTALYLSRMSTGSLAVGMTLHALWDFGTLGVVHTKRQQQPLAGIVALLVYAGSMVAVWFVVL
ncbi:MAG: CPBP family intramembrane glutamic endopeptidase [Ilumatobacteraceae bacterium]